LIDDLALENNCLMAAMWLQIGPTGTGKSAYINAHLTHGLDRKAWVSMVFNFSAQTSANMTQVRAGAAEARQLPLETGTSSNGQTCLDIVS
jgi:hypothetical protein